MPVSSSTSMPAVLTVEEAAGILRIGRSAAYAAVKSGDIPAIKVGRSLRVPRHKLESLLGVPTSEFATAGNGGEIEVEGDSGADDSQH